MTLEIKILLVSLDHDDIESVVNFPLASDMLLVIAVSITVTSSILSIDIRKENIFFMHELATRCCTAHCYFSPLKFSVSKNLSNQMGIKKLIVILDHFTVKYSSKTKRF